MESGLALVAKKKRRRSRRVGLSALNGLAGFRFALRQFLSFSEAALSSAGVTSHQYQAMLAIRVSEAERMSIKELAAELLLRPNGAVQLVDRLVTLDMVGRSSSETDRRSVLVSL